MRIRNTGILIMAQVIVKNWELEFVQNALSQLEGKLNLWNQQAAQGLILESNKVRPTTDNTQSAGDASFRFSVVYAGTGTINTSDEREKQQIGAIDAKVLKAWGNVNFVQFKMNNAVEVKNDGARWHFGLIAQQVKTAFEAEGLDAFDYGLLCFDEWEDKSIAIADGEEYPKVNRYGIRYEEALALECAYLRSKV